MWGNKGGWRSGGWGQAAAAGGGGVVTTVAYTNFVARTSGLNTLHLDAYKALFSDLTSAGIFNSDGTSSKLDILYVHATQDSTTALLNLVNTPARNCTLGAGSASTIVSMFVADSGCAQNSATDWLNTNYDPAVNMVNLNLANNCCLFGYDKSARGATNAVAFGCRKGGGDTEFFVAPFWSDNNTFFRICDGSPLKPISGGSKGWFAGNRSGATATEQYFNPAGSAFSTGTDAAQTPTTGNTVAILGLHETGTSITFPSAGDIISVMGAGASMNATQHTALWNAVKTYLTTVGAYP